MGYASVMRVPRIHNYADALKRYDNTKPIKGRDDEPRPLGERRYVDTYSIRKNIWTDAVELVLYKTPVIKFTVEDECIINIDNWPSASTCQFIDRVIPSVRANRVRGDVVLHFFDDSKAMLPAKGELALVRDSNGRWLPKVKQTLYDYRVNRKEANNVRKSVSQFRDYLAGVVKLKGEEVVHRYGMGYESRRSVVSATYAELIEVFGEQGELDGTRVRPNADAWAGITNKPPTFFNGDTKADAWANYYEKTNNFFDLVKNDQCDNTRHQNYWIAFNVLFVQGQSLYWRDSNMDFTLSLGAEYFEKHLEMILFKMFADKVFKRVALDEGKVPTGRYDEYVLTEED